MGDYSEEWKDVFFCAPPGQLQSFRTSELPRQQACNAILCHRLRAPPTPQRIPPVRRKCATVP
eukprot:1558376-Pyramimonas_sp.AAC.1